MFFFKLSEKAVVFSRYRIYLWKVFWINFYNFLKTQLFNSLDLFLCNRRHSNIAQCKFFDFFTHNVSEFVLSMYSRISSKSPSTYFLSALFKVIYFIMKCFLTFFCWIFLNCGKSQISFSTFNQYKWHQINIIRFCFPTILCQIYYNCKTFYKPYNFVIILSAIFLRKCEEYNTE